MGYLDEYGENEAKHERRIQAIKRAVVLLLILLAAAGILYYWLKNYKEEKRVEAFLAALQRGDYAAAYTFWGCRVESPCPNYDYKGFLEDWGEKSAIGKLQSYKLLNSHERGSGVIVTASLNGQPPVRLWVEKKDQILGFAPP
ncbi:MAG TPA: hypothetical protein VEU62_20605, partial [Bryobacterales bacterium]|nr:hypothetical protein [Bryobacterales bacterium]